jgi:hypothetical protein
MAKRDSNNEPGLNDVGVLASIGIAEKKRKVDIEKVHEYDVGVLTECLSYVESCKFTIGKQMDRCQETIDFVNANIEDLSRQKNKLEKGLQFQVTLSNLLKDLIMPNSQVIVSKLGNMVGTGGRNEEIEDESRNQEDGIE